MIFIILNDILNYLQNEIPDRSFQLNFLPSKHPLNEKEQNSIYITLLNISTNPFLKNSLNTRQNPGNIFKTQDSNLMLDLSIIISSCYQDYSEGLKAISDVIQTFATDKKFTIGNITYTIEMYNLSIEQNSCNHQDFSANLLPKIVYKIRFISVEP